MTKKKPSNDVKKIEEESAFEPQTCGIIMPISGSEGYSEQHWRDVKEILETAIKAAGFVPKLVSDSDEAKVIHENIVSNLYENPIVVCDVSSRNPNVMFELGMRLAFDMPVVIIKDNENGYSFDVQPIEHLEYKRNLKYNDIERFILDLEGKIKHTFDAASSADGASFLSNFGRKYRPKKIQGEDVEVPAYMLGFMEEMKSSVLNLRSEVLHQRNLKRYSDTGVLLRAKARNRAIHESDMEKKIDEIIHQSIPMGDYPKSESFVTFIVSVVKMACRAQDFEVSDVELRNRVQNAIDGEEQ